MSNRRNGKQKFEERAEGRDIQVRRRGIQVPCGILEELDSAPLVMQPAEQREPHPCGFCSITASYRAEIGYKLLLLGGEGWRHFGQFVWRGARCRGYSEQAKSRRDKMI